MRCEYINIYNNYFPLGTNWRSQNWDGCHARFGVNCERGMTVATSLAPWSVLIGNISGLLIYLNIKQWHSDNFNYFIDV